jgi:hypothetical protein
MNGQLSSFADFSPLRGILEEKLFELVPTKFTQSYDWGTSINDFPSSDPIFLMDRSTNSGRNADRKNDLVLKASVTVDVRSGTRQATAIGDIAPFKIRLMGNSLDLITIGFTGARFERDIDGKSSYEAKIGKVEIGKQLEFIQKLQEYLGPKGNGPYVTLQPSPPSIEAGYRFATSIIQLGSLTFQNIAISVSMLLPFDQRPALFQFAFASRENPFLISNFPYGGGGFVRLIANAKGLVGFELSFEFGAVTAIEYGPMKGHGRITAGIGFMSLKTERENLQYLEGFVKAIGSGQIACFGMCINMEICIRQDNGGDMVGSSTYSFTFSVWKFEYGYEVMATERISGKSSSATTKKMSLLSDDTATRSGPQTVVRTPRKQRQWNEYRRHLAL